PPRRSRTYPRSESNGSCSEPTSERPKRTGFSLIDLKPVAISLSQLQPLAAISESARGKRTLFGNRLFLAAQPLAFGLRHIDGREQAEIHIHRLERTFAWFVIRHDMSASDMPKQGTECRGPGRRRQRLPQLLG